MIKKNSFLLFLEVVLKTISITFYLNTTTTSSVFFFFFFPSCYRKKKLPQFYTFFFFLVSFNCVFRETYYFIPICVGLYFYHNKHHVCELEMGTKSGNLFGVIWVRKNEKRSSENFPTARSIRIVIKRDRSVGDSIV